VVRDVGCVRISVTLEASFASGESTNRAPQSLGWFVKWFVKSMFTVCFFHGEWDLRVSINSELNLE
jgi:hypothetical protein